MPLMSWVVYSVFRLPDQPARILVMSDRSGGSAPPLAARAALSLGNGLAKASDGSAGRSNMLPEASGPSVTLYSAAIALTCSGGNSGPPGSPRLRKRMSDIEWQAAHTSL